MRKLYWSCLAGGVLMLVGSFTTLQYAVSYPNSLIGQAAYTASRVAATFNPMTGFGRPAAPVEDVTEGPAEVCEAVGDDGQRAPFEFGVVAEPTPPIQIPEEEIPPAEMPVGPDERCPVRAAELGPRGVECPCGEHGRTAPARMPYCEEELCEIEEGGRERLPMPRVEGEEEEQEAEEARPLGGAHRMMRLFEKMLRRNTGGVDTMEHRPGDRPASDDKPPRL